MASLFSVIATQLLLHSVALLLNCRNFHSYLDFVVFHFLPLPVFSWERRGGCTIHSGLSHKAKGGNITEMKETNQQEEKGVQQPIARVTERERLWGSGGSTLCHVQRAKHQEKKFLKEKCSQQLQTGSLNYIYIHTCTHTHTGNYSLPHHRAAILGRNLSNWWRTSKAVQNCLKARSFMW